MMPFGAEAIFDAVGEVTSERAELLMNIELEVRSLWPGDVCS